MFEKLWNAQTVAKRRRVHLTFRDATTGDNKDPGTLTGIKANVRLDGSDTLVPTSLDVAKANQTDHLGAGWVEFTLAELQAFGAGELIVSVSGIAGVKVEDAQATLYTFDPNDPGASGVQIADALLARNQKGGSNGPSGQTVADALAGGLLDFTISNGVITVKNGDGSTAFTRTLTRDQTLQLGAILGAF